MLYKSNSHNYAHLKKAGIRGNWDWRNFQFILEIFPSKVFGGIGILEMWPPTPNILCTPLLKSDPRFVWQFFIFTRIFIWYTIQYNILTITMLTARADTAFLINILSPLYANIVSQYYVSILVHLVLCLFFFWPW